MLSVDLLSYSLQRTGWSRFASTFFLFFSQVIVTEFALGLVFALNGLWLTLLNFAISIALLAFLRRRKGASIFNKYLADLIATVKRLRSVLLSDPLWATLLLISTLVTGWIVFIGSIFPATDFDGNSYHLTFIGNVIQNDTFFDRPTSLPWLNGYPKGGEFIAMWNVLIPNSDIFAELAQVPFFILGVYALYEIAVRLGASKKQARFSSLLFLFLPIVLNQLKTTYVDVMLSTLFFAGIAILIKKKLNTLDLLIVGAIFSLLIAVKSTGILFIIALSPLLIWSLHRNRKKNPKSLIANYIKPLSLVAAPMVFGLYWYIKNLVVYGSPIYPFGFKVMGISIFPGKTFQEFAADAVSTLTVLPTGSLERIWFVWTEQKDWFGCLYNYDANFSGFGPIWFIILIPAVLIAVFYALKKKDRLYFAVIATMAAVFVMYPSNYYSRYTMFIAGIGILSLAIVLTNINKWTVNVIKGLTILLALFVFGTNIALCNFPPRTIKEQIKSLGSGSTRGAVFETATWRPFALIESRTKPGDVVAYDSSPYFIYPLWRTDFSNNVIYIPAENSSAWIKQVKMEGVDYVLTTLKSRENGWAQKSSVMKSIYKDDLYEIYEIH